MLISSSAAYAKNSTAETVSTLCSPADISDVTCDSSAECAIKTQNAIRTFAEKYEVPAASSYTPLEYPKFCYNRAAVKHIKKIRFDKTANGYSCIPASLTFKASHEEVFAPIKYTTNLQPPSKLSEEIR